MQHMMGAFVGLLPDHAIIEEEDDAHPFKKKDKMIAD